MSSTQIELDQIREVGEKLGLKGPELKDFILEERVRLKDERDAERKERALEREAKEEPGRIRASV